MRAPHYVYVLDCDHGVKIGITVDLDSRMSDFRRGQGFAPRLLRSWEVKDKSLAREIEQRAHWLLDDCRTQGEWFHCHPLEAVAAVERFVRDIRVPTEFYQRKRPALVLLQEQRAA